jgi:hypothetical protein
LPTAHETARLPAVLAAGRGLRDVYQPSRRRERPKRTDEEGPSEPDLPRWFVPSGAAGTALPGRVPVLLRDACHVFLSLLCRRRAAPLVVPTTIRLFIPEVYVGLHGRFGQYGVYEGC